jgi:cell division protein FtsQ
MGRLASLAAERAQPLRPALRARAFGRPARRTVVLALAALAGLALAYAVARETPLFAVGEIEVSGASPDVRREVKGVLSELVGTSLVEVDASDVEAEIAALPSVLGATVDRSFPHVLRVAVVPEEPLAVLHGRDQAWIVSRRLRVIRAVEAPPGLPRVRSSAAAELAPGEAVADTDAVALLHLLAAVPRDFPVRIRAARGGEEERPRLVLAGKTELRLGSADDLDAKLAAAAAVLDSLPREEARGLAYLDVSLPQRPVALPKSQVSSEGLE